MSLPTSFSGLPPPPTTPRPIFLAALPLMPHCLTWCTPHRLPLMAHPLRPLPLVAHPPRRPPPVAQRPAPMALLTPTAPRRFRRIPLRAHCIRCPRPLRSSGPHSLSLKSNRKPRRTAKCARALSPAAVSPSARGFSLRQYAARRLRPDLLCPRRSVSGAGRGQGCAPGARADVRHTPSGRCGRPCSSPGLLTHKPCPWPPLRC
jgi:hypothetical protein